MRLTQCEKKECLGALAEMIASTIDGASSEDVHEVLSSSHAVPENWREMVQRKVEMRCGLSGDLAESEGVGNVREATLLPILSPPKMTCECLNCGAYQDIVDARKSLRHSATSSAVGELSTLSGTFCSVLSLGACLEGTGRVKSMSQTSSFTSSLGSFFMRDGVSKGSMTRKQPTSSTSESYVRRLPVEIMHRIFVDVIEGDNDDLSWIGVLSTVCRRWYCICQHPVMWEFVSKKIFVVYPLVQRLQSAPVDQSDMVLFNSMRRLGAPEQFITQHDTMEPLIAPTNRTLRESMEAVMHYQDSRRYYEYVKRRRVFVLQMVLSWILLLFSLFLGTTVCTTEGIVFGDLCALSTPFSLLWMTYLALVTILIANIVIEAHFEPKPLFYRLRKNKPLILRSITAIFVGIFCLVFPTLLVQINIHRTERFAWLWCGITPIASLCLWQMYVFLSCIAPDAWQKLHEQRSGFRPKPIVTFLVTNVPYAFPILFAGAIFCLLHYVEHGGRVYLLIGVMPVFTSLAVLTLLFFLDFCLTRQSNNLVTGLCLFVASLSPLSLMWMEFRGLCLLPAAAASFFFFLAHMRLVASKAFQELVDGAHGCGRGWCAW